MSASRTDHKAEQTAKVYLEMRGYQIIEQNYRRSRCEIAIIAKRQETIYFVAVNYHRTDSPGNGLEYLTTSKLQHMQLAAETWVEEYKWHGAYQLAEIEIAGSDFVVLSFIENVL